MSRAAVRTTILSAVIAIAAFGLTTWVYIANSPGHKVVVTDVQHHATAVSYRGQSGQTALTLLEKYATVRTKHYSFGDMVLSIDGTVGNGPKYWTFYVNGKEAAVGASSYVTKDTDAITWKLQ